MTSAIKPSVIAIVGPTCTGKTNLSITLAHKINGEIIALDSRTVYKKMDIGTAKPSLAEQEDIKHYAIDLLDPRRFFTVAEYVETAKNAIDNITMQGKIPILCGGTGLYAQALLEGIQIPAIEPQPILRAELEEIANQKGNEELYIKLQNLDPATANRLNVNDRRRIIRAIEVSLASGIPFSQLAKKSEPLYETTWIGLNWSNRDLHKKMISERLHKQVEDGLIDEVFALWQNDNFHAVLNNSVNYKEFIPYFKKNESLERAREQCIKSNFHLARKQMIWFRNRPFINWLPSDEINSGTVLSKILQMLPDNLLPI